MDKQKAVQEAFENFEEWNNETGLFQDGTQYMAEMQAVIMDAVEFGYQAGRQSKSMSVSTVQNLGKVAAMLVVEEHFGKGCRDICEERIRQQEKEGFDSEHDEQHANGELSMAGASYAIPPIVRKSLSVVANLWPWHSPWWKPTPDNRQKELTKAGALIAADKDRIYKEEE